MQIRPATRGDFPAVRELFGELHAYNATFDPSLALNPEWPALLEEIFERTLDEGDRLWALAWDSAEAVGLIVGESHVEAAIFGGHPWFELAAIYVRPSHRRGGVAAQLVAHLEDGARAHGHNLVQLYVTAANVDARAFYTRHGYHPLQEIWRKRIAPADAAPEPPT